MPRVSPATIKRALDLVASGMSSREAAEELGFGPNGKPLATHTSIQRWVRAAKKPAEPSSPIEPTPTVALTDDEASDTISRLRARMRKLEEFADEATKKGNPRAAIPILNAVAKLEPVLTRAERESKEAADVIVLTRAELEAAKASYRARVKALAERGLRCQGCGRELSIEWGLED